MAGYHWLLGTQWYLVYLSAHKDFITAAIGSPARMKLTRNKSNVAAFL